ncbi:MAG: C_GCAxxG_C_C family protein [Provencibacterium sp.]|nr:C_GCAxxG_C_C family protein [Provencibacterium sp.]
MGIPETAKAHFFEGYNCAQSVLLTLAPYLGLSEETALLLASPFGGGMGRMRQVCGTVSAMYMALGLREGYTGATDAEGKEALYERVQRLAAEFSRENGSILCRDLLATGDKPAPDSQTTSGHDPRCGEYVRSATALILKELGLPEAPRLPTE